MWTPAYPDRRRRFPSNLGGLGGIQQETAEMGKEKLARFSAGKKACTSSGHHRFTSL